MRPDQCFRADSPEAVHAAVESGRILPGDAVEILKFMAYQRDVADGMDRAEADGKHYPEDAGQRDIAPGRCDPECDVCHPELYDDEDRGGGGDGQPK